MYRGSSTIHYHADIDPSKLDTSKNEGAKNLLGSLSGDQLATFRRLLERRNLEQVLSRLRRITALLEGTADLVDQMTAAQARDLDAEICRLVDRRSLRLLTTRPKAGWRRPPTGDTTPVDETIDDELTKTGRPPSSASENRGIPAKLRSTVPG